ncbi:hypothetical protein SEA_JONJAMES_189 [Gordonia Phage JonJames]|nr:hypothetical protein SEA_JONJAMES_189 [Gordonia Phage JonJames]
MATIEELTPSNLSFVHRQMNKELMVAWINADLLNRCALDVRTAHVWYDEDKNFLIASGPETPWPLEPEVTMTLHKYGARYHSVGV